MVFKSIIGAVCAGLAVVSLNAGAAVVSMDWQTSGDNLITHDSVSKLDWLDLTVTNAMSYDYVSGQLGPGGRFEGWRYASLEEVVSLWNNFGIDLGTTQSGSIGDADPRIVTATGYLGNTLNAYDPTYFDYGVLGLTNYVPFPAVHQIMGAFHDLTTGDNIYFTVPARVINPDVVSDPYVGSYLVMNTAIPIPAAAWLFGSGLLGIIGVARSKVRV